MVEAGRAGGRRRGAAAFPGVEPDVMMVAAGGDESGLLPQALHQLKTEHAAVERQRAIEIGDLEMHVADAYPGIDRCGGAVTLLAVRRDA